MSSNEPDGLSSDMAVAAVLGRIEANVSNLTVLTKENSVQMKEIDSRLRAVETAVAQKPDDERFRKLERTVDEIVATKPAKVPWWTVAAGIASIAAIVSIVFLIFNLDLVVS